MVAKSLLASTAVVIGLLAVDVAAPNLTDATAQARSTMSRSGGSASRSSASRTTTRTTTRSNVTRSNAGRSTTSRTSTTTRINRVNTGNANRVNNTAHTNRLNNRNNRNNNVNRNTNTNVNRVHTNTNVNRVNTNVNRVHGPNNALRVGPGGAGRHNGVRPQFAGLRMHNRMWPINKGGHRIWWGGGWKKWWPVTAVSAVLIGGSYYWADSYVTTARPYCTGVTPDGCRLNWQFVGFEGGGGDYQCVSFCQRPGVAAPAQAVAFAPAAEQPAGKCELTIFAEPGFGGASAPTNEDQPRLDEVGWKNQVSSVQVASGTWEFYTDDEFQGENMRLPPGPYPQLGQDWTKRIGSFMCVQGQ